MSERWLTRTESEELVQEDERVVAVACPCCHAPLLTRSVLIGGAPSVCLDFVVCGGSRSRRSLHVSSLEGDFTMDRASDADIPKNARLELFCPRCGEQLPEVEECGVCHQGRMVQLEVVGGKRKVRKVCPQRGCKASHEGEIHSSAWGSTFMTSGLLGAG